MQPKLDNIDEIDEDISEMQQTIRKLEGFTRPIVTLICPNTVMNFPY
jgi:hypothetical protein